METQLSIARELEYIDLVTFKSIEAKTEELGRILNGLVNRFQTHIERIS